MPPAACFDPVSPGSSRAAGGRLSVLIAALALAAAPGDATASAAAPPPMVQGLGGGWQVATLPQQKLPVTHYRDEPVQGREAVRLEADASYGHLLRELPGGTSIRALRWDWRVARMGDGIALDRKQGDDTPVKVCISYDWPLEWVPVLERQLVRLARSRTGQPLPAATLCWVWGEGEARESLVENPYTRRVRSIVLRNRGDVGSGSGGGVGDDRGSKWLPEARDVERDLRRAFGDEIPAGAPLPPATALYLSADADNTGGRSLSWVAGLRVN